MKKTALVLIFVTIFSKFIGLLREVTLAYFYGASNVSDAYLVALTIPAVLFSFVGTGIVTGFIPIYQDRKIRGSVDEALKFTNNLINIVFIIITIMIMIAYVFVNQIVFAFASGFEKETFEMAVRFTKVSLISSYFIAIVFILSGFLQANELYNITSLIGLPLNVVIILSIFMSYKYDLNWLPYGIVFSALGQVLFLLLFSRRVGYKHRFIFKIRDDNIYKLIKISMPVIIGVLFYQLNVLIDRTLASRLAMGGISALNYSNKIVDFVQGIFVISVTTISYPLISKHIVNNNFSQVRVVLKDSIGMILLLVIPASIGSMFFSKEIITMLYGRGAIDTIGLELISKVFFMYSIGMIAFGLKEGISKVFYAMQDSKTPMRNAIIGYIVNAILSVVLSIYLGIEGIALATSISMFVITFFLFVSLRRKIGAFGFLHIIKAILKISISSFFMGVVSKTFYGMVLNHIGPSLALLFSILLAIMIYFTIIYIFKIEDVDVTARSIIEKIKGSEVM
ncbi:murein biosynthesis integral membrane protein MurJ [Acetoanaerobium sticklandii]|uniref:murein biosynthesis integral membrane protein MurJ n=1 Tax=Acetoanaerobium sticklandii TaxID=1511 RepID=UPI003A9197EF